MDKAMIDRLRAFENEAWRLFLKEYGSFIQGVIKFILRDPENIRDCYQEILMRLPDKLRTFTPSKSVKPWLYKVVYNYALEFQRRQNSQLQRGSLSTARQNIVLVDNTPNPEENYQFKQYREAFLSVQKALSGDIPAIAFFLRQWGFSYRDIGDFLFIDKDTAKSYVPRGEERVRKKLLEMYPDFKVR